MPVAGALAKPLTEAERQAVVADVRGWLGFQETLSGWKPQKSRVAATPFVALYARGELRGCMGSLAGGVDQQLARAFLSAAEDTRFGGVRAEDRPGLVAEVTYLRAPRFIEEAAVPTTLEVGTHGIGLARGAAAPVFLLPNVARDSGLDPKGMLVALHRKAGAAPGRLFLFESESVVARRDAPRKTVASGPVASRDAAAAWLASLVRRHGAVTFAQDARTGAVVDVGKMHHGRAASVLHALAVHGGHRAALARGRQRLALEVHAALAGRPVDGWPEAVPEVAGTLALAVRAGVEVKGALLAYVQAHVADVARVPWHAAQVVAALGVEAPPPLWDACLADLPRQPWSPWTVLGFHARGEPLSAARPALAGLVAAIRDTPPHEGAVYVTGTAEVAITALTVEALLAYPRAPGAQAAIARGRAFLRRQQVLRETSPACFAAEAIEGAFVAAPAATLLRGDVTAHALLASA